MVQMTREQIKAAKDLWARILTDTAARFSKDDLKPVFRMSAKTCDAVTFDRVLMGVRHSNEVVLDGYRIIIDNTLPDGRIERKAGLEL